MYTAEFDYYRPKTLNEAIALLGKNKDAKVLAGGHSLLPAMKLRVADPGVLVDIGRLKGLSGIKVGKKDVKIGALTTHAMVAASKELAKACPILSETAALVGDTQVRNRGTLGGSLAHADPAADYPATMLAVDAELHLKGPKGWRKVKASDFFQGLFTVDLAPGEMIVGIQFTPVRAAAYAKLHQRASHFAIVGVAAAVEVRNGIIQWARIGLTGAGTHATRLTVVEKALAGQPATKQTIDGAARLATLDEVSSDIHASETYRRAMIPVFTRRALEGALARA